MFMGFMGQSTSTEPFHQNIALSRNDHRCSHQLSVILMLYVPGYLSSSGGLTGAGVHVRCPVITCAVKLMIELLFLNRLRKEEEGDG